MSFLNTYKSSVRRYVDSLPRYCLFGKVYSRHIDLCTGAENGTVPIERYQRTALARVLKHALTTVPFYRRNYQIDPDCIKEENAFEVLQRFEYLDKATVMASPKEFVSDKYRIESLLSKTSSGSTGQGIRIFYSRRELGAERAYVEYPWYRLGFTPWALVVQANEDASPPDGSGPFRRGLRRVDLRCHYVTPEWTSCIIRTLRRIQPDFLHGYASVWVRVAQEFRAAGLTLPVRGVFLCSEQVFPDQVVLLQKVFGPVSVGYGQSERSAIAYGGLKDGRITYKLMPTYAYTENPLSPQGSPEIVGTNLFVEAMPLIRYHTQDLGAINSHGEIVSLDGRLQEMLVTRDGHLVSGTNVTVDSFLWDYVESYQVVQNAPGVLELHIVRKDSYNAEVEKVLLEKQTCRMGRLFMLQIVYVTHIERTAGGKQRWVVSHLKADRVK